MSTRNGSRTGRLVMGIVFLGIAACGSDPLGEPRGILSQDALGSGTCEGACGGQSEDGCWCDESCAEFGDCCGDKALQCDEPAATLTVNFDALPPLGEGFVYEGWLIVDGSAESAARFPWTQTEVILEIPVEQLAATLYVLTIEPEFGDDPAPSPVHLVGGSFVDGVATLSVDHRTAIRTDFETAEGRYILAAPTSPNAADYDKGIWFGSQMSLPSLANGWTYEGWVVGENGPVSTGRFRSLQGEDSDGTGPTAGPLAGPPIPGQDFIDPPVSLIGNTVVISVEPEPDDSPAPFALKPLIDDVLTDVGDHGLQAFERNSEPLPTGTAVLSMP
ncbi:MAG: hypothetical protein AAFQ82_05025 [Myxococcota bacterium]